MAAQVMLASHRFFHTWLLAALAIPASSLSAATLLWTGGGANDLISTATNWNPGQSPVSGDALVFTGATRLAPQLGASLTVASLTFNAAAESFALGGAGVFTLNSGGILNSSVFTQTIGNALQLGASQSWNASAGNLTVNGNVTLGAFTLTVSGLTTTTLGGIIGGAGNLTKSSNGTLVLTGANTYTGTTNLSAGTVSLGTNTSLGSGTVSIGSVKLQSNGGSRTIANTLSLTGNSTFLGADDLTFTGNATLTGSRTLTTSGTGIVTFNGNIGQSSARRLTKAGTGTLVLNGANTFTGTTLSAGTLILGQNAAVGTGTFSLGTATLASSSGPLALANAITLNGNTAFGGSGAFTFNGAASLTGSRTLTVNDAPVTFNGTVSQSSTTARSIIKNGSGTLTLGGTSANTFTGGLIVNDGLVILAKPGGVNAIGGGTLTVGNTTGNPASAILRVNASSVLPSTTSVVLRPDGLVDLQGFTAGIGTFTATGGSVTGTSGSRLDLGGTVTSSATGSNVTLLGTSLTLNGTRTFSVNNNSVTNDADLSLTGVVADGSASGSLVKTGSGTLLVSGANTYTGGTSLNNGTILLDAAAADALGTGAVNLGDVSGTFAVRLLFAATPGRTLANALVARTGSTGSLTLGGLNTAGVNTFSGNIALGHLLTVSAEAGGEIRLTGSISGTGFGLTKTGSGVVRLTAENSYGGATTISQGTLALGVNGALGSGSLTVNGAAAVLDLGATQQAAGTVTLDGGALILGETGAALSSSTLFAVRNGSVGVELAGSAGLTKSTSGTVILSGVSSYTGATAVNAGTLRIENAGAFASGTALSVNLGATLDLNDFGATAGSLSGNGNVILGTALLATGGDDVSTTFSGGLSGSGGLTKTGAGTFTLGGSNTYTGATAVAGGTLQIGSATALAPVTAVSLAGGTLLDLAGFDLTIGSLTGAGEVALGTATLTAGGDGSSTTFAGGLGGTGGFIKDGASTLTLTASSGFTGALEVKGGTLALAGAAGSVTTVSSAAIGTDTTLLLDNSGRENSDRLSDTAAVTLAGGTLRLISGSGGSSETVGALGASFGASTVSVAHLGAADTSSALTFSSLGTIASGATVNFTATGGILGEGIFGPHIFILGLADGLIGGWATVDGSFAEYFADGVRAFSNTYSGSDGINLNDPTKVIALGADSPASAYTLTEPGTTTDFALILNDLALVDLGSDATRTLALASGGLIKNTALATTISGAGRLTAVIASAASLAVTVESGTSLTLSSEVIDNAGANGIYGDSDDGAVGLSKAGAGLLTLSGGNTFTGNISVNEGTLRVSAENNLGAAGNDLVFNGGTLQLTSGFAASTGKILQISVDLTGTLDIASGQTLSLADTAGRLVTGNTASRLIKTGPGAFVIQGANAGFDGTLQLNLGTLELRHAQSLGDAVNRGRLALHGGTLVLRGDTSTDFANNVTVSADATIAADRLSGAGAAVTHTLGLLTIGSQTLTLAGSNGAGPAFSGVSLAGTPVLSVTTTNAIVSSISGAFGFTKTGAGTLTLTGLNTFTGPVTIGTGTLRTGAANTLPGSAAIGVASGAVLDLAGFDNAVSTLTGSGSVTLGAGTLTLGQGNVSSTFAGSASGSGGLTKTGSGTLTLTGGQTYTGATTVNTGTLLLGAANVLGQTSAARVAGGATLDLASFANRVGSLAGDGSVKLGSALLTTGGDQSSTTFSGGISGTGSLAKTGSGTLTLTGASTFAGATTLSAGALTVAHSSALGSTAGGTTVASGAELRLSNGVAVGAETLLLNGSGLAGNGALRNVEGDNSWAGSISLGSAATIGSDTASLTLTGSIAQAASRLGFTGAGDLLASGTISGSGGLDKTGSGTLTLAGLNSYTGTTIVSGGELEIRSSTALGATGATHGTTVAAGATLSLSSATGLAVGGESLTLNGAGGSGSGALRSVSGQNSWAGPITLASNSTVGVDADDFTITGAVGQTGGARDLTKTGTGTLILTGSNTYTGATRIDAGTLRIGSDERLADTSAVVVASGAILDLDDFDETVGSLAGAGIVSLGATGGGVLTVGGDGTSTTFSGMLDGVGDLVKQGGGTMTLAGNSTFTGTTTVSGGTLLVNAAAVNATTVAAGATLGGTGTVGALTVQADGTVAPGSSGAGLLETGNLLLESNSRFKLELAGPAAGTQYDQLRVTGSVTLAGDLDGTLLSGYQPTGGLFFIIANDGLDAISGTFRNLAQSSVVSFGSSSFRISYAGDLATNAFSGGNDVVLAAIPEPSVLTVAFGLLALQVSTRRSRRRG